MTRLFLQYLVKRHGLVRTGLSSPPPQARRTGFVVGKSSGAERGAHAAIGPGSPHITLPTPCPVGRASHELCPRVSSECYRGLGLATTLCPIIYYQHLFKEGLRQPAKSLVVGMNQILVPLFGAGKAEEEAVGEALLDVLHAYVCAPFERFDLGNQPGQAAECLLNLPDAVAGVCLEGEEDDVA